MTVLMTAAAPTGTSGYSLLIADDAGQVAAAQRLRHDVFATELGATLRGATADGRDTDEFDDVGVYFGTQNGEVYASRDEGKSWDRIAQYLPYVVSVHAATLD